MPQYSGEYLLRHLQGGVASSTELGTVLGQSQTTVSRHLRELISAGSVIRIGSSTRGARYGLLRPIDPIGAKWPLRRIDRTGQVHMLGTLNSIAANQFYFEPESAAFAYGGVTNTLPYYLQDQRPAGFLGRAVPRRYPELHLPQRVADWSDDHYLRYLTQRGSDAVGDLILGDQAFDQFMIMQRQRTTVTVNDREARYPQFVAEVMEGGLPGSSAHGEHPKFPAIVESTSGHTHVLVKFSPPNHSAVGQRWSDLLVAEHIAHEVLADAGLPAARSRIERYGDRTYLEVERFDRVNFDGRVGVTSLLAIDAEQYGNLDNWIDSATRLRDDRRIDPATCELVRLLSTFGALIANTDRHFGNMAFYDGYDGRYSLAPVYDMLPMFFAPEHDQVTARIFQPPDPTSQTLRAYGHARMLAEDYWRRCARDSKISHEFQAISAACGATLEALPRTGVYTYQPAAG
jgi:hypothetical protein